MNKKKVDIIINYFNPKNDNTLVIQTYLVALKYKNNTNVNIIISDGSGHKNNELYEICQREGFDYVFCEEMLSFPNGYNQGINYALQNFETEYILLSANDIFVDKNSVKILIDYLELDKDISCVIPYLSNSDLTEQNDIFNKGNRYPNGMTLNVNLFRKEELVSIGLVPEDLSGYFNDMVMFDKLKKQGKKVLLVNAGSITHFGKSTTSTSTTASFEKDKKTFEKNYPWLKATNKNLALKYSEFSQSKIDKLIFWLLDKISSNFLSKIILLLHRKIVLRFNYEK